MQRKKERTALCGAQGNLEIKIKAMTTEELILKHEKGSKILDMIVFMEHRQARIEQDIDMFRKRGVIELAKYLIKDLVMIKKAIPRLQNYYLNTMKSKESIEYRLTIEEI